MIPKITAGAASQRNSHLHPAMPSTPSSSSRAVEIGAPSPIDTGIAAMKPAVMRGREPVCEIKDHAREEARFGKAEQKAQDEEAGRPVDECKGAGNQTPADHHAGDPSPRADPLEDQIARHLQYEITPEERPGAEPENIGAQAEILVHGQRRESDVHAVEITDEVKDKAERQDP